MLDRWVLWLVAGVGLIIVVLIQFSAWRQQSKLKYERCQKCICAKCKKRLRCSSCFHCKDNDVALSCTAKKQ